jgi:hypothetical protein
MEVIDTTGAKYPMRAIKFSEEEIDQMLDVYGTTANQEEINQVRDNMPVSIESLVGYLVVHGLDDFLEGNFNVIEAIEQEGLNWIDIYIARYRMYEYEYWRKASTQFRGLE